MLWWHWMILGAVLLGAEMFAIDAQFYLVFLGLSAALVGLAGLAGISLPEWAQWIAFSVLSLVFMVTFRKSLYEKLRGGTTRFSELIAGEYITITADLAAGDEGRVQYRGSDWTARNTGSNPVSNGDRVKVVKVEGLTLHVEAE